MDTRSPLLAAMPALLGTAAVAPALPLISAAFPDVSETLISFIITLPPLATALSGFVVCAISDKYGRKKVLLVSLALFGFAGVSGFFLDSVTAIIIWRMWLGVGLAGLMPTVTTLFTEYYDGPTRGGGEVHGLYVGGDGGGRSCDADGKWCFGGDLVARAVPDLSVRGSGDSAGVLLY